MCHPKRKHFVEKLEEQLPDAEVVWDEVNNRWDTGRRSLLAYDPRASHHLVVQDDALVCDNFTLAAAEIAKHSGEHPVAFYIGRVRPHQRTVSPGLRYVQNTGGAYLAMQGPWWGVAVMIPTHQIEDLVRWGDVHNHISNYDKRMARWYDLQHIDCWYTVPSLVDHRRVDENPSLVKGRTGDRRAQWFIGDKDPLKIDWSQDPTPIKSRFKHRSLGRVVTAFVGSPNYHRFKNSKVWEEV